MSYISSRTCETDMVQSMVMRMRMTNNQPGSVTRLQLTFEAEEANR